MNRLSCGHSSISGIPRRIAFSALALYSLASIPAAAQPGGPEGDQHLREIALQEAGLTVDLLWLYPGLPLPSPLDPPVEATAQETPPSEAEAPQEGETGPGEEAMSPTAKEILEKAAAIQGGAEIAADLKSFEAKFETEYYHPEKGKIYYQVRRIFKFPQLMWTEKKHDIQDNPSHEVYDGEDGWFITPEGQTIVYTDKPSTYKTDIENLEEDVRLTKEMFKYFFIANLAEEIKDLKRLKDSFVPRSKSRDPAFVLEGKTFGWVSRDREKTLYLRIYVDKKRHQVAAVRLEDLSGQSAGRTFLFQRYMRNRQEILVPTNIKIFKEGENRPEMALTMECEAEEESGKIFPIIVFNQKVDAELFILPDEKEDKED